MYLNICVICLSLLFFSCNSNAPREKEGGEKKGEDTTYIRSSQNTYQFIEGKLFDYLSFQNDRTNIFFEKENADLRSVYNKDIDGFITNYNFKGGELVTKTMNYEDGQGRQSGAEVISYKDGVIDYENSSFVSINVIKVDSAKVTYKFNITIYFDVHSVYM